jgi:hypothetical protein
VILGIFIVGPVLWGLYYYVIFKVYISGLKEMGEKIARIFS